MVQHFLKVCEKIHDVGERLRLLHVIASHIRADAAALRDMHAALLKCGLTVVIVHAEEEHEDGPLQCMYVWYLSARVLYGDAVMK